MRMGFYNGIDWNKIPVGTEMIVAPCGWFGLHEVVRFVGSFVCNGTTFVVYSSDPYKASPMGKNHAALVWSSEFRCIPEIYVTPDIED